MADRSSDAMNSTVEDEKVPAESPKTPSSEEVTDQLKEDSNNSKEGEKVKSSIPEEFHPQASENPLHSKQPSSLKIKTVKLRHATPSVQEWALHYEMDGEERIALVKHFYCGNKYTLKVKMDEANPELEEVTYTPDLSGILPFTRFPLFETTSFTKSGKGPLFEPNVMYGFPGMDVGEDMQSCECDLDIEVNLNPGKGVNLKTTTDKQNPTESDEKNCNENQECLQKSNEGSTENTNSSEINLNRTDQNTANPMMINGMKELLCHLLEGMIWDSFISDSHDGNLKPTK